MPRVQPRTPATENTATLEQPQVTESTLAKDYIAAPSGIVSTDELDVGQQPDRVLKSEGDAGSALDRADLGMVSESPMDQDWIDNMRFMAEMIDIQIAESDDPNAAQIIEININGRLFLMRRGEVKTVPRYVADHMLRMKQTRFSQKEVANNEGVKDIIHPSVTTLKYPMMIMRDANPMGQRWYKFTVGLRG